MAKNPVVSMEVDGCGFPRATGLSFSNKPQSFTTELHTEIPRYPWQVFQGLGWPTGVDEEDEFKLDITVAAKGKSSDKWERGDVSVLMGALRTSATFAEVHELLPGINASRLLGAYEHLEAGLRHSLNGWNKLTASSITDIDLSENGTAASLVLSATVSKLRNTNEQARRRELDRIMEATAALRINVDTIHEALETIEPRCLEGIELGRLLFAAGEECLYGHPFFTPSRVGELSPLAVDIITRTHEEA